MITLISFFSSKFRELFRCPKNKPSLENLSKYSDYQIHNLINKLDKNDTESRLTIIKHCLKDRKNCFSILFLFPNIFDNIKSSDISSFINIENFIAFINEKQNVCYNSNILWFCFRYINPKNYKLVLLAWKSNYASENIDELFDEHLIPRLLIKKDFIFDSDEKLGVYESQNEEKEIEERLHLFIDSLIEVGHHTLDFNSYIRYESMIKYHLDEYNEDILDFISRCIRKESDASINMEESNERINKILESYFVIGSIELRKKLQMRYVNVFHRPFMSNENLLNDQLHKSTFIRIYLDSKPDKQKVYFDKFYDIIMSENEEYLRCYINKIPFDILLSISDKINETNREIRCTTDRMIKFAKHCFEQ